MGGFELAAPMRRFAFGVLALTLMLGSSGIDRASGQELAPFITVYEGTGSAEIAGAIAEYIQDQLGVEVRFEALSHGVIHSRVQAEAPHFGADLVTNAGFPLLQQAKEEGWSVSYKSPGWADADAEWADPDGHWWINSRWNFVLVANEPRIAEAGLELPKSWDDLLDPQWKDQIVMPSPATSGTAYMMLYSFITEYGLNRDRGEEGGWEYLEALNQNVHHYTRGGNAPTDLVGRGEFMLGLTSDEQVLPRLQEGYPITMIIPEEGIGFGMQGAAILAGTDRLATVQKVVDLMGTEEFSKFLAGSAGYTTRFPDAVPGLFADAPPRYIPNIDLGWALAERDRIMEEWMERIGRVPQE
jgi:iron(III) transport system substrate-binding protein